MSLHVDIRGQGPNLVLLHGWGFSSTIWFSIVPSLEKYFRLYLIDLPGHGRSPHLGIEHDAKQLAACIAKHTPEDAHYLGWSMGATIAMCLALQHPEREHKLILVAGTPCFTNNAHWKFGVENEVFQAFTDSLEQNYALTIKRFLALQCLGNPSQKDKLRALQAKLKLAQKPDPRALRAGLQLLQNTNLTTSCQHITQDCLLIHSESDKLAPLTAAQYLEKNLCQARLVVMEKTGHTPFINQPETFCLHVKSFLYAK